MMIFGGLEEGGDCKILNKKKTKKKNKGIGLFSYGNAFKRVALRSRDQFPCLRTQKKNKKDFRVSNGGDDDFEVLNSVREDECGNVEKIDYDFRILESENDHRFPIAKSDAIPSSGFQSFRKGDIVWAREDSSWWPGWVCRIKSFRCSVKLFGSGRVWWFRESEIHHFEENYVDFSNTPEKSLSAAINCALEELGRRAALGLLCRCRSSTEQKNSIQISRAVRKGFRAVEMLDFVRNMAKCALVEDIDTVTAVRGASQVCAYRRYVSIEQDWIYHDTMRLSERCRGSGVSEGIVGTHPEMKSHSSSEEMEESVIQEGEDNTSQEEQANKHQFFPDKICSSSEICSTNREDFSIFFPNEEFESLLDDQVEKGSDSSMAIEKDVEFRNFFSEGKSSIRSARQRSDGDKSSSSSYCSLNTTNHDVLSHSSSEEVEESVIQEGEEEEQANKDQFLADKVHSSSEICWTNQEDFSIFFPNEEYESLQDDKVKEGSDSSMDAESEEIFAEGKSSIHSSRQQSDGDESSSSSYCRMNNTGHAVFFQEDSEDIWDDNSVPHLQGESDIIASSIIQRESSGDCFDVTRNLDLPVISDLSQSLPSYPESDTSLVKTRAEVESRFPIYFSVEPRVCSRIKTSDNVCSTPSLLDILRHLYVLMLDPFYSGEECLTSLCQKLLSCSMENDHGGASISCISEFHDDVEVREEEEICRPNPSSRLSDDATKMQRNTKELSESELLLPSSHLSDDATKSKPDTTEDSASEVLLPSSENGAIANSEDGIGVANDGIRVDNLPSHNHDDHIEVRPSEVSVADTSRNGNSKEICSSVFPMKSYKGFIHGKRKLDRPVTSDISRKSHKKTESLTSLSRLYASPLMKNSSISSSYSLQSSETRQISTHPISLHMKFPKDFTLPSKDELEKIFIKFGPLDRTKTKVFFFTGSAQVFFSHRCDAEAAYQYTRENNVLGLPNVRFWLDPHENARRGTDVRASSLSKEGKSTLNLKSCLKGSNVDREKEQRKPKHVKFLVRNQVKFCQQL